MHGFFKVRMRRFSRWFVFTALPSEQLYEEWLYFDQRGVPIIYWNRGLGGVILM